MEPKLEIRHRYINLETANIRAEKTEDKRSITGLAIPYNVETVLWSDGGYEEREIIYPGAIAETKRDVVMLWNHKSEIILGRQSAKTLNLKETDAGVEFENFPPESPEGISKYESINRGDVKNMSFGFNDIDVLEEKKVEGEKRIYIRHVKKMDLWELSPVTWPAYESTTAQARDIETRKKQIEAAFSSTEEKGLAAARQREAELRDLEINTLNMEGQI